MPTETSFLSVLPNLSIGVVAILCLVYTILKFLAALDRRAIAHEAAMQERETALRQVERDVRNSLYTQLSENTAAMQENTKVLSRVVQKLDGIQH